jgi:hypothetical protein
MYGSIGRKYKIHFQSLTELEWLKISIIKKTKVQKNRKSYRNIREQQDRNGSEVGVSACLMSSRTENGRYTDKKENNSFLIYRVRTIN